MTTTALNTRNLEIVNETARQIGGRAFFMMGTRNKIADGLTLRFDIKNSRSNFVEVEYLPGSDTYTVRAIKAPTTPRQIIAGKKTVINGEEAADCDSLRSVISTLTGLHLSL